MKVAITDMAGQIRRNLFLMKLFVSSSPSWLEHSFSKMYPIKNPLSTKNISTPRSPFANGDKAGNQCLDMHLAMFSCINKKEWVPMTSKTEMARKPSRG